MIPADKQSQFKAPHTQNNIYQQYCSHIVLDKNTPAHTKISWRLAHLRYFPEFRFDSKSKNDVIVICVCKVIRYVVSTMHKLQTLTRLQNGKDTVNFRSVLS